MGTSEYSEGAQRTLGYWGTKGTQTLEHLAHLGTWALTHFGTQTPGHLGHIDTWARAHLDHADRNGMHGTSFSKLAEHL